MDLKPEVVLTKLVELFPGLPPIEEITQGRNIVEVYESGEFCQYCPAFAGCNNEPARLARVKTELKRFVNSFPGAPPIEEVLKGRELARVYMAGEFCQYCPSFGNCNNEPASHARSHGASPA